MAGSDNTLPLSGIRVIDLTSLAMGPLAAQTLGDYGADVIKFEPPGGDIFRHVMPQKSQGMSHAFIQFNRNKRSIGADLKTESGKEILRRLVSTTDVIVTNMRPVALKELGFDYEALRKIKSDIIFCAAYGFSECGPYAGRPAADDTIQAMSGLVDLQNRATGSRQFVASVIADKAVALVAVNAVMAALIHRMKTGAGQSIEVPMFETMVAFVMPEHLSGQTFDPPLGKAGYIRIMTPERKPYATSDGFLSVMPYTTAQWVRFFGLLGRPDLADDPNYTDPTKRSARAEELYALIGKVMPTRTTQEWVDALTDGDILFGKVNTLDDLLSDPQLAASNMFVKVEHPTEGSLQLLGFPVSFSETPNKIARLPPNLGQHSEEILRELGYSSSEIQALQNQRVVVAQPAAKS